MVWTHAVLNFSVLALSASCVIYAWQLRKLQERVFRLEAELLARECTENFLRIAYKRIENARDSQPTGVYTSH